MDSIAAVAFSDQVWALLSESQVARVSERLGGPPPIHCDDQIIEGTGVHRVRNPSRAAGARRSAINAIVEHVEADLEFMLDAGAHRLP